MLDYVEKACINKGLRYICLMANYKNVRAQKFYLREGYTDIGEIKDLLQIGNIEHLLVGPTYLL